MLRKVTAIATNTALGAACAFAIAWLLTGRGDMEAATTVSALFAAIAGIRAERWATVREQRERSLEALRDELRRNREIIADKRFRPLGGTSIRRRVFPRLNHTAADAAVTSGLLRSRSDRELNSLLYHWRDAVRELNHRLDLTEVYLFSADTIQIDELRAFDDALNSADGILTDVSGQLAMLEYTLDSIVRRR